MTTHCKLWIVVEVQRLYDMDGLPEDLVEAPGLVDGQGQVVRNIAIRTLAGAGTVRGNPQGEHVDVDASAEEGVIEHIGAGV